MPTDKLLHFALSEVEQFYLRSVYDIWWMMKWPRSQQRTRKSFEESSIVLCLRIYCDLL